MEWFQQILSYPPTEFITYTTVFAITAWMAAAWAVRSTKDAVQRHTEAIVRANIEHPERPLTVSFSPDYPGLRDAYRTDFWVRVKPGQTQVLFFHPGQKRWQTVSGVYGVGYAFINGKMVTFRSVPTDMDENTVAALQQVAETREIPPALLSKLSDMDHNEVFSVVEALGMVRQFDQALQKIDTGQTIGSLKATFAPRALDL